MIKLKQPEEQVEVSEAPLLPEGAVIIWTGERNSYKLYFFLDPRISCTIFYHILDLQGFELGSYVEFDRNSYYKLTDERKIEIVLEIVDKKYLEVMWKGKQEYVSRGLYLH